MKAAVVTETGLALREVPDPKPAPNQVLIRVRAIGMNRADLGVACRPHAWPRRRSRRDPRHRVRGRRRRHRRRGARHQLSAIAS